MMNKQKKISSREEMKTLVNQLKERLKGKEKEFQTADSLLQLAGQFHDHADT
jgi:hypothetical protein